MLPKQLRNKIPIETGSIVIVFYGMGCNSGIVLKTDKRKSLIRYIDNKQEFVYNKRISVVQDLKLKNFIIRQLGF